MLLNETQNCSDKHIPIVIYMMSEYLSAEINTLENPHIQTHLSLPTPNLYRELDIDLVYLQSNIWLWLNT